MQAIPIPTPPPLQISFNPQPKKPQQSNNYNLLNLEELKTKQSTQSYNIFDYQTDKTNQIKINEEKIKSIMKKPERAESLRAIETTDRKKPLSFNKLLGISKSNYL